MGIFNKLEVTVLPQTYFTTEEKAIARNNIDAIEDAPTSSTYVRTSGSWVELNGANYSAGPNIDITNDVISSRDWSNEINAKLDTTAFTPLALPNSANWDNTYNTVLANSAQWSNDTTYTAGSNIDITNNVISGKDWSGEINAKLDTTAFSLPNSANWDNTYNTVLANSATWNEGGGSSDIELYSSDGSLLISADDSGYDLKLNEQLSAKNYFVTDSRKTTEPLRPVSGTVSFGTNEPITDLISNAHFEAGHWVTSEINIPKEMKLFNVKLSFAPNPISQIPAYTQCIFELYLDNTKIESFLITSDNTYTHELVEKNCLILNPMSADSILNLRCNDDWFGWASICINDETYRSIGTSGSGIPDNYDSLYSTVSSNSATWNEGGGEGSTYTAGPNIDITDNTISGRDWTPELNTKLDSTAFTLPTSSDWTKTYETVTANSASWDAVSAKLNTTAFSTVSGNFLTDIPDEYSTKDYVQSSVSSKLDSTAFSTVSGSFLTAHQDLSDYLTKNSADTLYQPTGDYATHDDLTAYQPIGDYADATALDGKVDTSSFTAFSSTTNEKIEYISGALSGTYELSAGSGIDITDYPNEQKTVISVTAQGGNPEVSHDNTLSGNGTVDSPLSVVPGYHEFTIEEASASITGGVATVSIEQGDFYIVDLSEENSITDIEIVLTNNASAAFPLWWFKIESGSDATLSVKIGATDVGWLGSEITNIELGKTIEINVVDSIACGGELV